jgi:hypothetical protein
MYDEALNMLEEPAWVKAELPIAYVAEKAGMQFTSGDGRLHALCPFHEDHDPSFDVYPWGGGERFGCFSCGAAGDVLDFVMRMWPHLGFRQAVEFCKRGIAKMKEEGWQRPSLSSPWEWNPEAARALLSKGQADEAAIYGLIQAKGWLFSPSHLTATWNVRVVGEEILVPLWDENRMLVGMKHRRLSGSGSLISLPGSQLRSTLYGAGRSDWGTVLLCEGESDAWTASWLLRDRRLSVMSLPAGAGAAPTRLDLLTGRDVIIALDGDEAGRLSAARWHEALGSFNSLILPLPDGHDITSISAQDPSWLCRKLEV